MYIYGRPSAHGSNQREIILTRTRLLTSWRNPILAIISKVFD